MLWNVQGLQSKLNDLDFLDLITKYDILFFTETWTGATANVQINGFHEITCNRPKCSKRAKRDSGGIVIYCKNKLSDNLKVVKLDEKGIVWLKLPKEDFKMQNDVYFCICYIPPERSRLYRNLCALQNFDFFDNLSDDIRYYSNIGSVYICGDMNGRTGERSDLISDVGLEKYVPELPSIITYEHDLPNRTSNDKSVNSFGLRLLSMCKEHDLRLVNGRLEPGMFTCYTHNGCSVVDYLITSPDNFAQIKSMLVMNLTEFSDHCPIQFELNAAPCDNPNVTKLTDKIVWGPERVDEFKNYLRDECGFVDNIITNLELGSTSIDDSITYLTDFLYDAAFRHFGKTMRQTMNATHTSKNAKSSAWFNDECRAKKALFLNAKRMFNGCQNDANKTIFLNCRSDFCKAKRKAKCTYYTKEKKTLSYLSATEPRKFWKKVNTYRKSKSGIADSISLDEFVRHFQTILNSPHTDNEYDDIHVNDINIDELDMQITEEEVRAVIRSMKCNKCPGMDNLPAELFINAESILTPYIVRLFNVIFNSGIYPDLWAAGIIVPIPKKGDKSNVSNYRGITLINSIAKLFSLVLRNRLNSWCETNEVFCDFQYGFRNEKSTVDCIFLLKGIIDKVLGDKGKLFCAFIDYEKAFDTVMRDALWLKLVNYGVSTKMITMLKAIYRKVLACVRVHSDVSDLFDVGLGVKQGEPLSPLLFLLFVNDAFTEIKTDNVGAMINHLCVFMMMFADDMILCSTTKQGLQTLLDKLGTYSDKWGLKVNTGKTKICVFEKRKSNQNFRWKYKGDFLDIVEQFCYLGINFKYTGNMNDSVKMLSDQALKSMNNLISVFGRISVDINTKLKLFDALVKPILLYGSEVLGISCESEIDKIHIKYCKSILGLKRQTPNAAVYGELGRLPISILCKERVLRFWLKLVHNTNTNISPTSIMYNQQLEDVRQNPNVKNWANRVKSILDNLGFSNVWINQNEHHTSIDIFKQRLRDQYIQSWRESISAMPKLEYYCQYKHVFEMEFYVTALDAEKTIKHIASIRLGSHNLEIETGRFNNVIRAQRICKLCNMNCVESEYHFLCICPAYSSLRRQYIHVSWPTLDKYYRLLSTKSKRLLYKLGKYVNLAMQTRLSLIQQH
ncbi:MAG: reverse transcriptase domain-containing protein [Sedimenticola sp.]